MVHQLTATTRSGGSPPAGWSPTTPAPASTARMGSRPGRTGRCGSPTTATTRSGGSPPPGWSPTTPPPASTARTGSRPGPDGALWFTNARQRLDRADHHRRGGHQLHRPASTTRWDHGRAGRGAVVHQLDTGESTTRSGGSPPPGRSPTTPPPASTSPEGIAAGPDGALWFTNDGNDSIGRITTSGKVTNYTGTGIDVPGGDRGGARRGAVVHQLRRRLRSGGSPPPGWSPTTPATASSGPYGIRPGPTGRCGSPTRSTTRSGGSRPRSLRRSAASAPHRARREPR